MKSAEQHQLFPLGFPHGGALSTRGAGSMLQMAPNNRLANDRVPEKHQRHSLICKSLTASKRIINWLDASASDYNVAMTTSAKHIPAQFQRLQNVVIVGGGVSGLATALALHRLGIKPLLLEQADHLRTAGATLLIWTNAWKALEALGVANRIRKTCDKLSGLEFFGEDGASFLCSGFDNISRDFEVRGVERKTLLEILKESLPDGTAIYDSRVIGIKKLAGGFTEVQCENGRTIETKVLIGCDGAGSVVRKWMNMDEPRYVGYTSTRGLSIYPHGHNLGNKFCQILGGGVRAGIVPMDANRVYWFVVFNCSGERVTDVEIIRKEALNYVEGWPAMITEAIIRSPLDTLSRRGISDRWMWPIGGPPLYKTGVTLAGDAMHPMTPNLGQGGCLALEDAVVLARELSKALSSSDSETMNCSTESQLEEIERIELAFKAYIKERWPRVLSMGVQSYLMGALLQLDSKLICSIRNKLLPQILQVDSFAGHTFYDCGTLQ